MISICNTGVLGENKLHNWKGKALKSCFLIRCLNHMKKRFFFFYLTKFLSSELR